MADDVSNFIADHGLRKTTLIGHSMGAKTAMTLALRSPNDVADIIAVDNAPVDSLLGSDFSSYIRGMKKVDQSHVTKLAEADKILQEVENNIQTFRIPLDTLGAALGHLGDFPFKDPNQFRFEKRALFVRGTKSKYVPDEVLPAVGQFFPNFRLIDIDAGHWVISEKPEEFRAGTCPDQA
ncbi:Abhydrolase domain-containing protein C22H12.03 [Beauveria bassiana]|uniref:Abhydrolase domain-containing protein C22H12.03 n=1 Tax=Beauveria bassiana TaxID=176275 RepID=A0A2N6NL78_BEABA|nr:Abhydrolase domain-containing protein C22H12.03 [Beauveria bassiana]